MHRNKTRAIIKRKLNDDDGEVSSFMLLVYIKRMNNKNTVVAVINIYCNYVRTAKY